jgi:hypothetical protein
VHLPTSSLFQFSTVSSSAASRFAQSHLCHCRYRSVASLNFGKFKNFGDMFVAQLSPLPNRASSIVASPSTLANFL